MKYLFVILSLLTMNYAQATEIVFSKKSKSDLNREAQSVREQNLIRIQKQAIIDYVIEEKGICWRTLDEVRKNTNGDFNGTDSRGYNLSLLKSATPSTQKLRTIKGIEYFYQDYEILKLNFIDGQKVDVLMSEADLKTLKSGCE